MSVKLLRDQKEEYLEHLFELLFQPVINVFQETYDKALQTNPKNVLKEFQHELAKIPEWNQLQVDKVYQGISCNYFPKLIKTVYILTIKIVLLGIPEDKRKKMKLRIPSPDNFYHRCLIHVARELWKRPYLFYHLARSIERQNNLYHCEVILRKKIKAVIRETIPMDWVVEQMSQDPVKEETASESETEDEESSSESGTEEEVASEENESETGAEELASEESGTEEEVASEESESETEAEELASEEDSSSSSEEEEDSSKTNTGYTSDTEGDETPVIVEQPIAESVTITEEAAPPEPITIAEEAASQEPITIAEEAATPEVQTPIIEIVKEETTPPAVVVSEPELQNIVIPIKEPSKKIIYVDDPPVQKKKVKKTFF